MRTFIPFTGFYESLHDAAIDTALDQMFCDDSGNTYDDLVEKAIGLANWRSVHNAYASSYTDEFAERFGVPCTFVELISPREYNFTTDRILVDVPDRDMRRVFAKTPFAALEAEARAWFTSRSGFVSFYSPIVTTWGMFKDWDANQRACLLSAYVKHMHGGEFDQWQQHELMEDACCNGHLDGWISDALGERGTPLFEALDRRRGR